MPKSHDLVFLCAGRGTRVGLKIPKQFVELRGKPMMVFSLEVYERIPEIGRKVIVHAAAEAERVKVILDQYQISNCLMVEGGETRQESVRRGLASVATPSVVTHNASVAFIAVQTVRQVIAIDADCVTTAIEVRDNMVRVEEGALRHISRHGLRVINSPQMFRTAVFRAAHDSAQAQGLQFNTDAELMLYYDRDVSLVPGPPWSFKITETKDLAFAEAMLTRPDLFPGLLE